MKNMKAKKLQPKNIVLILGTIYTMMTILAVISYVSSMEKISSTPVTFGSVIGAVLWQLVMIVLFVVDYFAYSKKKVLGSVIEVIMGIAMLVYMIISIALIGANLFAIIVELIYPLILVLHGLNTFKKYIKDNNK